MATIEIRRGNEILERREVPDERAHAGISVRIAKHGEARVSAGKAAQLGPYSIQLVSWATTPEDAANRLPEGVPVEPLSEGTGEQRPDIDGYEIQEFLGRGGMGVVWRAIQIATKRDVALKVMGVELLGSRKARARFEREVKLAAGLEHPGIARIYDSGVHKGLYFYAMQLVTGEHLDAYVRHKMLDRRSIIELMVRVCRIMAFAHNHSVVHRDLKPSNILVDSQGQPTILDFGLARTLEEKNSTLIISVEGEAEGTPAFMSPEQAAGHQLEIDRRTDVYALGTMLYRFTTGRFPKDMSGPAYEVLRRLVEDEVRPPRFFTRLDRDLEAILLKACAHKRNERYGSASELADDLERYLAGVAVAARPYSRVDHLRRQVRRHRTRLAGGAGVLLMLGGATYLVHGAQDRARRADAAAESLEVERQREHASLSTQLATMEEEVTALRTHVDSMDDSALRLAELQQRLGQSRKEVSRLAIEAGEVESLRLQIESLQAELEAKSKALEDSALVIAELKAQVTANIDADAEGAPQEDVGPLKPFTAPAVTSDSRAFTVGSAAPAWSSPDSTGKRVNSHDYAGRVLVLFFWATWSGPDLASMPTIQAALEHYAGENVTFLAMNVMRESDRRSPETVAREHGLSARLVYATEEVAEAYRIRAVPQVFVISQDGLVAWVGHPQSQDMRTAIDHMLKR